MFNFDIGIFAVNYIGIVITKPLAQCQRFKAAELSICIEWHNKLNVQSPNNIEQEKIIVYLPLSDLPFGNIVDDI